MTTATVTGEGGRGLSLQWQMGIGFAAGLLIGLAVHYGAGDAAWVKTLTTYVTAPLGQLFLRLLFMLVIPLLFSALVVGIAEMGEIRSLRRIGLKTLGWTIVASTIAVIVSLVLVNLLQPGSGVDPDVARQMLADGKGAAGSILERTATTPSGMDALLAIVPTNIVTAMANNDILAVMFFALFFGIGLVLVDRPETESIKRAMQGLFEISMRLIGVVIRLAPIAVFCFMFNLAALFGWDLLVRLSAYVGVVVLALGVQMFVIFPALLMIVAKRSPIQFFRDVQEAMVMAFSTASSNASLPTALRVADEKLKLPAKVGRFVLTIGATANQNGTAMFEGVTVIFLAQFFGVDLSLWQQVTVMLICILGGIGTAGVPAGSLPVVALILGMVGVPPEGIGLVLGVDRFLDMCRTTLNVTGDLALATLVASGEDGADEPLPA
ncbi:dicarboxylate/amino acid:cation symporter [Sphingomonas sp. BGYR3]|uniref:dicarboxylate/amino acid:cation symporter n=1 Tax=Sphingomonas sp. BGYR3 TaxID=2975483 RepID=UPI0021A67896|nr:dicarboxylate/amino acid:cation symporter [Sphingomonas sp. BGYR3]MDG5487631.1 dicarboxylate/amino acid:cation symporter [Sphingomonas sp. BGYR3]